jgi:hypothetical protein
MYSTLTLALPEDDRSIIENVSEDDKTCGHTAWAALVNHYEDDVIYRCTELLQDLETPQADSESCIQYLNRAPAGGAAAAAPEGIALACPSAPTSTSTRWALVTP